MVIKVHKNSRTNVNLKSIREKCDTTEMRLSYHLEIISSNLDVAGNPRE